jgi:hypothetical protein
MIVADAKTLITQSLAQAMGRMAYLEVQPCLETPPAPARLALAEIRFAGSVTGSVQVMASFDFARELACTIGLLDHPTEEQCLDAIRELVNVSCGLILPLLATPDTDVFDLSIPQAIPCDESTDWNRWILQDDVVVLDVDGHPIAARLNLRS